MKTLDEVIVIDEVPFDYNFGLKVLKLKYRGKCPHPRFEDGWDKIRKPSFNDILTKTTNLESRRVALSHYGIENLVKKIKAKLISKETIKKKTTWINEKGVLEEKMYDDTYELYRAESNQFGKARSIGRWDGDRPLSLTNRYVYFVKFKCTSTNRVYILWVDKEEVEEINGQKFTAIGAIAWTIRTNIRYGNIEEIIRQGDCILIKPKKGTGEGYRERSIAADEYIKLLKAES